MKSEGCGVRSFVPHLDFKLPFLSYAAGRPGHEDLSQLDNRTRSRFTQTRASWGRPSPRT